jgi:hypothetical protein
VRAPAVAQSELGWDEPVVCGDCVVEERYWSGNTEIICRVNHSQMARIRAAKGLLAPPLVNACVMSAEELASLQAVYGHMDTRRQLHLHEGGATAARGRRPGTIAFPVAATAPALALASR